MSRSAPPLPGVRPVVRRPVAPAPSRRQRRASRRRKGRPSWFWRWRRVWFLLGLLFFTAIAGVAWVVTRIPLPSETPLAQTTIIYDSAGHEIAVLHGVENRFPVRIDQVPKVTQDAVLAAEDKNFFSHGGLDPVGILRATWADVRAKGTPQGGSTITQQYVKNAFVGSERTLVRKLKEAAIAVKLERKYDKKEILERYLNTVYFGRGAYGIQAAAQAYFGLDAPKLGLRESAYLAGLIRTPSAGDLANDPVLAARLRTMVLQAMVETRAITPAQAAEVEAKPLQDYVLARKESGTTVTRPGNGIEYFVEYVRQELVRRYGEDQVLQGGLRVYTTLDPEMQKLGYDAVYGFLSRPNDPAGALVSLDKDGKVVAMVGGKDWGASKVNLAVGAEGGGGGRQGGSAFKPFVLAQAFREGYTVNSTFPGPAKLVLPRALGGEDWTVNNYENAGFGRLNLIDATAFSVNTVYAQMVTTVGAKDVATMAKELGIGRDLEALPSIALGTQNVSVLEMARAYLTFANDGLRTDSRVLRKVTVGDTVLLDDKPRRTRVLERREVDQVNQALEQVVKKGSGVAAQIPGGVRGKTGTSEDYGDAWFVGYNDKLTTAVWMGYPQGQSRPMLNVHGVPKVNGGSLPALIFRRFMTKAAPGEGPAPPTPEVVVRRPATTVPAARATSTTSAPAPTPTNPPPPTPTAPPPTVPVPTVPIITVPPFPDPPVFPDDQAERARRQPRTPPAPGT